METISENVKTIARFPYNRALLLQGRLQADGIDCFLSHQNLVQAAISMGVEIKVRESDMEKALKLIELYKEETGVQKEKSLKTLKNVRRILVPVDFSPASEKAIELAVDIANMLKAEIRLFHVYYNPVIEVAPFDTSHTYQVNLTNYLHEIEQTARHQLTERMNTLKQQVQELKSRTRITHSMSNGIAADEIIEMSRKYKPGLIIMGSKGMGKQTEGMIGSVTLKVIAKSEIPVIALPEKSKLSKAEDFRHILYATDFDNYDQTALSRLINLVHPLKVTIHCVHISVGQKKIYESVKLDSLKKFINNEFGEIPLKCSILVSDDILNGLETYIRENPIDIIALTNHSRGLLNSLFTPSVTRQIMQRISKPLLVYKSRELS